MCKKIENHCLLEVPARNAPIECGTMNIYGMASISIRIPYSSKTTKEINKYKKAITCSDNDFSRYNVADKIVQNLSTFPTNQGVFYVSAPEQYSKDITEAFMNRLTTDD